MITNEEGDLESSEPEQERTSLEDIMDGLIDAMNEMSDHMKNIETEEELEMARISVEKAGHVVNALNQKAIDFFKGKSAQEVKTFLAPLGNETLESICQNLALDAELYEVCQAAKELIDEREKS